MAGESRDDKRVDCPICGHHGSRCQEDLESGRTICHETGRLLPLTDDAVDELVSEQEREW